MIFFGIFFDFCFKHIKNFDKENSFVMVYNDGGKFKYSIFIRDNGNNGTVDITEETDIDHTNIKKGGAPEKKLPSGTDYCIAKSN